MEGNDKYMDSLIRLLIERLKGESIFIIFCIALVSVLWYSNQQTTKQLMELNITTTKAIEQNNAIMNNISLIIQENRNDETEYWRERHDRMEESLKRIEVKVESLK